MIRIARSATTLLSALCLAPTADAAQNVYECVVKAVYALQDSGELTKRDVDPIIGARFMVDRDSGRITGRYLGNTRADTFLVLNRGNQANSFKVVWYTKFSGGGLLPGALEVREFSEGPEKPFLYAEWPGYLTGTCK